MKIAMKAWTSRAASSARPTIWPCSAYEKPTPMGSSRKKTFAFSVQEKGFSFVVMLPLLS